MAKKVTMYSIEIDFDREWNGLYFCGLISQLVDNDMLDSVEREVAAKMLIANSSEPYDEYVKTEAAS